MRHALEDWDGGFSVGSYKISNLRYADDTTLIAIWKEELVELMNKSRLPAER